MSTVLLSFITIYIN